MKEKEKNKDYNPPTTRGASAEAEEGGGGVGVPPKRRAPKEPCPLCEISEETIKRLKKAGREKKTEQKSAKNNEQ